MIVKNEPALLQKAARFAINWEMLDDFAQVSGNYQFAKCIRIACGMFIDKCLYGF